MIRYNKTYDKVWYVSLSLYFNKEPTVYIDTYDNATIKAPITQPSQGLCDINSHGATRPFCNMRDVFDNEKDAMRHKQLLIRKGERLKEAYRNEMIDCIKNTLQKAFPKESTTPFIANVYPRMVSPYNWEKVNSDELVMTDGTRMKLEDVMDVELLFRIIFAIGDRKYFLLSEDKDAHKRLYEESYHIMTCVTIDFELKLKGYKIYKH